MLCECRAGKFSRGAREIPHANLGISTHATLYSRYEASRVIWF